MRVLLVEDLEVMRQVLVQDLTSLGHTVVSASNGLEAMGELAKDRFELVFTDLVMPEMDGYELCEEIRRHPQHKNLPIVVLSSHLEASYVMEALRRGADDYIVKPANISLIDRVVKRVMADV